MNGPPAAQVLGAHDVDVLRLGDGRCPARARTRPGSGHEPTDAPARLSVCDHFTSCETETFHGLPDVVVRLG